MSIIDNINAIIKQKNLTKKEFAEKLMQIEPKSTRIGETPSLKTIYAYLNGTIAIKAELIPYIAEVLGVSEQAIFGYAPKNKHISGNDELKRYIITMLDDLPIDILEKIKIKLEEYYQYKKTFLD